ncbi:MAG: hypothetical protein V1755_07540 [Chloroflexota bacterium]
MEYVIFGYDFDFFWRAAGAVLHGDSPYTVGGFFSPYPLALLLTPLALLPFGIAYGAWTLLKLALLARCVDRWSFLRMLLFVPVAFDLSLGQLDLLVVLLASRLNWIGAVISTLRPQLAIWIIPFLAWTWWKENRPDQYWKSLLGILFLFGLSTLIEPGWWGSWINAGSVAWQYNAQSASIFGLAQILPVSQVNVFAVVALLAVICLVLLRPLTPRAFWRFLALFNPVANVYSLVVLFGQIDWVVILMGVLALPVSRITHTNAVWALIPLYLVIKDRLLPRMPDRMAAQRAD